MPPDPSANSALTAWYESRIGIPATHDEARGYWVFALGVVLGIVGILAFLTTQPASPTRQWSIVLAAAGFTLLLAGPIIRLPLRQSATWLVYLGVVVCAAAIVWFVVAFPAQWSPRSGQPTIIGLYTAGLVIMAVGGVFAPVLALGRDQAADLEQTRLDLADTQADETDLAAQLRGLRTSQARFELYRDRSDEWRWRLRHRNGQLIASSGEGYTALHNAQNGLESVRRNALGATLLLIESEDAIPEVTEAFEPVRVAESRAEFDLYEGVDGEFRWRLVHENGNVLADGAEGYTRRGSAREAIEKVREYVGPADYIRPDPVAFEVFRDRAGEYRWRLIHRNGRILADSGEGYTRRHGAAQAVMILRERIDDVEFEVYEDRAGDSRWRARAANNELIADSGQGYEDRSAAREAVDRLESLAPDADVLDIGRAAFEVYEDQGGEFRWRLRYRNGNILADSGEGYASRNGCWEAIESVKRNGPNASVAA